MKELQDRIQAIRSLQTEMNLARQPESDHFPEESGDRSPAKLIEMPERDTQAQPATRSRRKSPTASKRKASASAARQQPPVPFRQLRENQDPFQQPFAEDLKRLEAQAARINQVVAERPQTSIGPEPLEGTEGDEDEAVQEPLAQKRPPKNATGRSTATRKKSAKGSKQAQPTDDEREVLSMSAPEDEESEQLRTQTARINRLLAELEETIREAGTVANESHYESQGSEPAINQRRDQRRGQRPGDRRPSPSNLFNEAPFNEAQFASYPQGDLKKAVREAAQTAQALRDLSHHEPYPPLGFTAPDSFARPYNAYPHRSWLDQLGLWLRGCFQVPRKPLDKLGDAFLWIVIAGVIRVGSRFLMATYPSYSPLIIVLMLAPAACAIYLALFVPKAGFVSVYRLFLIMLGLFLGGRL